MLPLHSLDSGTRQSNRWRIAISVVKSRFHARSLPAEVSRAECDIDRALALWWHTGAAGVGLRKSAAVCSLEIELVDSHRRVRRIGKLNHLGQTTVSDTNTAKVKIQRRQAHNRTPSEEVDRSPTARAIVRDLNLSALYIGGC